MNGWYFVCLLICFYDMCERNKRGLSYPIGRKKEKNLEKNILFVYIYIYISIPRKAQREKKKTPVVMLIPRTKLNPLTP